MSDTEMPEQTPLGSQSLLRGLGLMEILSNYPNGCPLLKLAEQSGLNKSTVHRLLQGLLSAGYVTHAPFPGSYRLTTKCLSIGQKALSSLNIIHIAAPYLETLNLDIGETVNFSSCADGHATLVYKLEPTMGVMRTRAYIGQQLSMYCSAMGKIFLAYKGRDFLHRYWQDQKKNIRKLNRNTITTLEDMEKETERILAQGYAVDKEENELGISCIAAPIFDLHHCVQYAVSISLATARLQEIDEMELINPVRETADNISRELGASLITGAPH